MRATQAELAAYAIVTLSVEANDAIQHNAHPGSSNETQQNMETRIHIISHIDRSSTVILEQLSD